jgi:hypothetical protein
MLHRDPEKDRDLMCDPAVRKRIMRAVRKHLDIEERIGALRFDRFHLECPEGDPLS